VATTTLPSKLKVPENLKDIIFESTLLPRNPVVIQVPQLPNKSPGCSCCYCCCFCCCCAKSSVRGAHPCAGRVPRRRLCPLAPQGTLAHHHFDDDVWPQRGNPATCGGNHHLLDGKMVVFSSSSSPWGIRNLGVNGMASRWAGSLHPAPLGQQLFGTFAGGPILGVPVPSSLSIRRPFPLP